MAREKLTIFRNSGFTGKSHTWEMMIDPQDWLDWRHGPNPIQVCMPYLTDDEREFIMTGITPEEWANEFGGSDDAA